MTNVKVPKLFVFAYFFSFSAPPFSVGETLHVAYKKYKIKRKFTFVRYIPNISSCKLKTSEFLLVLRTHEKF